MERLFIIIGRVNSVLLLLVFFAAIVSIAMMTFESNRWGRRGAVEVPDMEAGSKKTILFNIERIENIPGADAQMMELNTTERSSKYSSGGRGNETRNILFLTGAEKNPRWLFKDHKKLILVSSQLSKDADDSKDPSTTALYFEYVAADSDEDGTLSSGDRSNVAITKPDGTGFIEILHDIDRVISHDMLDRQTVSIVYQKGPVVRHAKFSVESMKLARDQEIISLPNKL